MAELEAWCKQRDAGVIEEFGERHGIPIARVLWAHEVIDIPQLVDRGFFEQLTHPMTGTHPYIAFPVRFSAGPHRWNRTRHRRWAATTTALLAELGTPARHRATASRRGDRRGGGVESIGMVTGVTVGEPWPGPSRDEYTESRQ